MRHLASAAVPAAYLAISLFGLVVVARGSYPIGLDFQGGAVLRFSGEAPPDLERLLPDDCDVRRTETHTSIECADLDGAGADELAARLAQAAPATRMEMKDVIEPARARWAGRSLALVLCTIACLLAGALFVARRQAWLVAAAASSVVAGSLGWYLFRGLTFTMGAYIAALWLALPTALAAALARGIGPRERLRRSWPGWVMVLVALGVAGIAARMDARPLTELRTLVRAGGFFVLRSGPVFAIGALCLFYRARPTREQRAHIDEQ